MLTVHICQSAVGAIHRSSTETEWRGRTAAQLIDEFRDPAWSPSAPVAAFSGGRRLRDGECVPDGSHVIVAPDPGVASLPVLVQLLLLTVVNIAIARLTAPSFNEQSTDDERSPAYQFPGMTTAIGSGFRVPVVYGRHDSPGHLISADVSPIDEATRAETVSLGIALSEGPIHSIGGQARDFDRVTPSQTLAFPSGMRVNGVALEGQVGGTGPALSGSDQGVSVSGRLGKVIQPRMRGFEEPRSVVDVGVPLTTENDETTREIGSVLAEFARVQIDFPSGLVTQTGTSFSAARASFEVYWRWKEESPRSWNASPIQVLDAPQPPGGKREPFSIYTEFNLAPPPSGTAGFSGFEVRVVRTTPAGDNTGNSFTQDAATFQRIVYGSRNAFGYPLRAVIGVRLRGTERFSGGRISVVTPVEGRTLRVWDPVHGISTREYFDLPEQGDPFHGIWTNQPGRNPAWQVIDYITNRRYGLGGRVVGPGGNPDDVIDWPAWRDFADYCDEFPHFCDIIFDRPVEAPEAIAMMLRCGRGVLAMVGRKISVRYQYRDAHGRGTNVVPARGRVDVIGTSSVEDFRIQKLPSHEHPNFLTGQFLNADRGYEADEAPLQDPGSNFDDPSALLRQSLRRQTVRMFGITDRGIARRELMFMHAVNRRSLRICYFTAGIGQIAVEPNDVIGVQHDVYRPFGDGAAWVSASLSEPLVNSTTFRLNTEVEIPEADVEYSCTFVDDNGDVFDGTVSPPSGLTTIPKEPTWTLNAPATTKRGTMIVIGNKSPGAAVQDFIVTSTRLLPDDKIEFECLEWDPATFDEEPPPEGASPESADPEIVPPPFLRVPDEIPTIDNVSVERAADGFIIRWEMPHGYQGRPAQVFGRTRGGEDGPYLLGVGLNELRVTGLSIHTDLWVVPQVGEQKVYPGPENATRIEVEAPEFRRTVPVNVTGVTATVTGSGLMLSWCAISHPELRRYEVRRGAKWDGAIVVGRTQSEQFLIRDPAAGSQRLWVRAFFGDGLPSPSVSPIDVKWIDDGIEGAVGAPLPAGTFVFGSWSDDFATAGTGVTGVGGELTLDDGAFHGEYTVAPAITIGDPAPVRWAVELESHEESLVTIGDPEWQGVVLGSTEAMYRTLGSRDPSPRHPGIDLDTKLAVVDSSYVLGGSGKRFPRTRVQMQVRYDQSGAGDWTNWSDYGEPSTVRSSRIEIRLIFDRGNDCYQRLVTGLRVTAYGVQ